MDAVHVLIVEDDPVMALHLEGIVARTFEAEVAVAASVAEAEAALERPFDLALLDVDVTDGKTFSLASRLVARRVPLAFVSASDQAAMPLELRAIRFLAKPYQDRDVVGLLRELRPSA